MSRGDAPFYELPYVELRGIPALRYQDKVAAMTELQFDYRVAPRWTLVGFGGLGQAAEKLSDIGSETTRSTIGGGFRYIWRGDSVCRPAWTWPMDPRNGLYTCSSATPG